VSGSTLAANLAAPRVCDFVDFVKKSLNAKGLQVKNTPKIKQGRKLSAQPAASATANPSRLGGNRPLRRGIEIWGQESRGQQHLGGCQHGFPQAGRTYFRIDILLSVPNIELIPAVAFALRGGMCYS
jgi:hypothetical protein